MAIWDDGDDLHAEPRAPYPHAREVLLLRAEQQRTALLVGGFARTVEAQQLLGTGWAHEIVAPRAVLRERLTVTIAESGERERGARLPHPAYDVLRAVLASDPVLVQTPRAGYAPSLACERCRTPARCGHCSGPLELAGPADPPRCRWCGDPAPGWACTECGHRGLRAPVVGESRTAEELGRSFPGVPVLTSGGDQVRATVPGGPGLVVATPGAEPVADGGYGAVVLLDTWLPLGRADLRAEEETLRRWLNAAALARPGGRVVAVGQPEHPALQALVRWDPAGFAEREAAQRAEAQLPAGPPARDHHRRARRRRRRAHAARSPRGRGGARAGPGRRRGPSGRPRAAVTGGSSSPERWGSCSGSARPASSTPCASRSTRRRSEAASPTLGPCSGSGTSRSSSVAPSRRRS